MGIQVFKNNLASTLNGAITNVATSATLATGDGAKLPTITGGNWLLMTLILESFGTETAWEIIKVTAVAGDVVTIVRAQEGTTALAWSSGTKIEARVTAGSLSTDGITEGATNLYHTAARVLGVVIAGLSTATNAVITAADSVLVALGKLQAQITGHTGSTSNPHSTTASQVGAPTTTGTGATGTWGIGITGNSATATQLANGTGYVALGDATYGTVYRPSSNGSLRHHTWTNYSGSIISSMDSTGNHSAASYAGSGSGLTGTAASLTAGYATVNLAFTSYAGDWTGLFQSMPAHTSLFREMNSNGPQGTWWFSQNFRHSNSSNYWGTQVAWGWEDNATELWQRNVSNGSYGSWIRYINSNNHQTVLTLLQQTVQAFAYANSWAVNSSYGTAGYWKDSFGTVHLQGAINGGASGTVAAVIPAGYRPVNSRIFTILAQGTAVVGWCSIDPSGNLTMQNTGTIWLDGISWRTT